jgi:transposase
MKCTPKVGQIKFTLGGAFFMSKYSEELKLKIVLDHKNKGFGARILSQMYGPDRKSIVQWIAQYELNGKFTAPTRHFSGEFKLKVLNYQQERHLSDQATALIFGITTKTTISAWRKKYLTGGTEALFQKQGRYSKMPKKSLIPNKPREEWTKDEELAYLRMENEYLKKYLALVQEDEKKKQQQKKDIEKSKLSEN